MKERIEEERSFEEIFSNLIGVYQFAKGNLIYIVGGIVIGVILSAFLVWNFAHRYEAYYKFTSVKAEAGNGGGFGNVISRFGLGIGTGGKLNPLQVQEISTSTEMFLEILDQKISYIDGEKSIADAIATEFSLPKKWMEEDDRKIQLPISCEIKNNEVVSLEHDGCWALKQVYYKAIGLDGNSPICKLELDKETNIYTMSTTTKTPELGMAILKSWFTALDRYYFEKIVRPEKESFIRLRNSRDSLSDQIEKLSKEIAILEGNTLSLIRPIDKLTLQNLKRQYEATTIGFAKVSENFAIAKLSESRDDVVFKVFDEALPPLEQTEPATLKYLGILGLFGAIAGLLLAWIIQNTSESVSNKL